ASLADRSGLLWLGGTRGLSRTDADASALVTIFGETSRPDGITASDALALLQAADGRLWVALGDAGIDVLDPVRGRVDHIALAQGPKPGSAHGPRPTYAATTLAQAPDGTVFIGSNDGLFRTDGAGRDPRRIPWQVKGRPSVQELSFGGGR